MTPANLSDTQTLYWALAKWAIGQGQITAEGALLLSRAGTRKSPYWNRHLLDLCGAIADKNPPPSPK